jgi:hypothetical protein
VKIAYTLPCGRAISPRVFLTEPVSEPQGPPPRIARLLALAHRLDGLIRSGEVKDYAHLARLGHLSAARVSQIMIPQNLAPSIQEYILFLSAAEARFITEPNLRKIAREVRWDRQRQLFEELLKQ